MNVQEFIRAIGAMTPPPAILLFCGGKATPRSRDATFEPFLAEQAVDRVIETYVDPGLRDLAFTAYYADEAKAAEIVLEAKTVPFLAERRVVLVRGAERYNTDSGAGPLLSYLESPCEMTVLILVASHVDRRTKFFKTCEKMGTVVECPDLNEDKVIQWARDQIGAREKTADNAAVKELVRRAGLHLNDVMNALNNVIGYIGEAHAIRVEDVAAACANVAEEEVWALTDAIAESDPSKALTALRRLVNLGRHEDELIGTINWLLKNAYAVAISDPGPPPISSFVAHKVRPLAKKLGIAKLRAAFMLCTDTQFMIRSTGVNAALALELLVVKLAMPMPVRRPTGVLA